MAMMTNTGLRTKRKRTGEEESNWKEERESENNQQTCVAHSQCNRKKMGSKTQCQEEGKIKKSHRWNKAGRKKTRTSGTYRKWNFSVFK